MSEENSRKSQNKQVKIPAYNRFGIGINVLVQLLLLAIMVLVVNYLCLRHPDWFYPPNLFNTKKKEIRWDVKRSSTFQLAEQSISLLSSLKQPVEVFVVFDTSNEIYDKVESLLQEYKVRSEMFRFTVIDKDRDLARVREMSKEFKFSHEENVVIFKCGDRQKFVTVFDMVDYEMEEQGMLMEPRRRIKAFKGEQMFTSAIQSVTQAHQPTIYWLSGHGEAKLEGAGETDMGGIAAALERENIRLLGLNLLETGEIPKDCDVLAIVSPKSQLQPQEIAVIENYLRNQGKLFVALDPRQKNGLENLLIRYGVKTGEDAVVGIVSIMGAKSLTQTYIYSLAEGTHPIVEQLARNEVNLIMPYSRMVGIQAPSPDIQPQPQPQIIVRTHKSFWAETGKIDNASVFDKGTDTAGPIPVMVAVEVGGVATEEVKVNTTKIVVVGSSLFLSNKIMMSADGNYDLFFNSINWMLKRTELIGIAPKPVEEFKITAKPGQVGAISWLILLGLPLAMAFIGATVWWRRRK